MIETGLKNYRVIKEGSRYCLYHGSKKMGCHPTAKRAYGQMAAIVRRTGRKAVTVYKGEDGARYMALVTSNSYRDREDDWITTEAWQEWVDKQWDGDQFVGKSVLDFWHIDPPIGKAVWANVQDGFLTEIYKERTSGIPLVQTFTTAIWDYIEKQDDYGASHLFLFDPEQSEKADDGRTIRAILDKPRSTALPKTYAANPYTYSGVLSMSDEQQKQRDDILSQIFGENFSAGLRALVGREKTKLDQAGIEHKSIGPSVSKDDLIDVLVVSTKEATKQVLEAAAQKDDGADAAPVDVRAIVEETINALMEIPETNIEDYAETLAVDETDQDEATPVVDDETKALLTKAVTAYDSVTQDNAALLEAFTTLAEQFKSFGTVPEALTKIASRVDALERQLSQRSKRATRAAETLVESLSPELQKAVADTEEAVQGEIKTYFDLPGSGRTVNYDDHNR